MKLEIVGKEKKDLREIIDWTKDFQMIYSGVENDQYFDILYNRGIRNFLMSYHYIQTKHISLKSRFENKDKVRLFIDSGAHTYQNDIKYAEMGVDFWEDHLIKYLAWAEKNKENIFAIANFDFENLVSPSRVNEWNKKYFEPFMLRTGIPVCFVWHQNSYQSWDYYCKRYPYVGFSSVNTEGVDIDLDEYKDKIRIAEKHDSLVHGFGMTRTSMLTQLPFYSSDSTTWLVGLQYGEINYWSNNKMSRLKKAKWKTTYLDELCTRYHLNKHLLEEEDTTELIKANIGAFIDAQAFINTRLKSQMYWLKARTTKQDISALDADFFPRADGFSEFVNDHLEELAKRMNINPEYEDCLNTVCDMCIFMNWDNPEYETLKENYVENDYALIRQVHDIYINRIVDTVEDMIADLIQFFSDCLSGDNDKLLQLGTNFDRVVKEREFYIKEDDEELVDMSPEEITKTLGKFLPERVDGQPDVDDLDDEIYREAGIVPVFDENNHFIKGQKLVKKPKQVYSKLYPKLACDTCYAAAKCAEYKSGYACVYNDMFNRFDTRDMADIIQGMQGIASYSLARAQKSMVMDAIQGTLDPVTDKLMDTSMKYLDMLQRLYANGSPEVLRQTRVVRADGSTEETTQITNPQEGGVLSRIFGNLSSKEQEEKEDVDMVETTTNKMYHNDD